jgi:ATP-dependent Clp protease adapter protein ClpS
VRGRESSGMTHTLDAPTIPEEDVDKFLAHEELWAVIVWNDDVTTFQTVIQAFVEILGHTVERADQLAWTIHRTGKAVAAVRPKDEAEAAVHALHLRKIQATLARA